MAQTVNAATELAREHGEIDRLAARIGTSDPGPERTALVHEVCARFVVHVQAEERYLHPVMCRRLWDGAFVAAAQFRRDRAVARTIEMVERWGVQDDEFDILVGHLVIGVQDHVEQHDTVLLPALVEACSLAEITLLGERLRSGIRAAREVAVRAGERACEQSSQQDAAQDAVGAAGGEPPSRGFRDLLRRIARGQRPSEAC
jgi:hypothetical protein